jgi:hypothetical protein
MHLYYLLITGHVCLTDDDKDNAKNNKGSLLYGELLPRGANKVRTTAALFSILFSLISLLSLCSLCSFYMWIVWRNQMVLRQIPFFSFPIRISVRASHSLLFGICMTVSACSAASLAVEKHFRNFIRSLLTSSIVTHPFYCISSSFIPSEVL